MLKEIPILRDVYLNVNGKEETLKGAETQKNFIIPLSFHLFLQTQLSTHTMCAILCFTIHIHKYTHVPVPKGTAHASNHKIQNQV